MCQRPGFEPQLHHPLARATPRLPLGVSVSFSLSPNLLLRLWAGPHDCEPPHVKTGVASQSACQVSGAALMAFLQCPADPTQLAPPLRWVFTQKMPSQGGLPPLAWPAHMATSLFLLLSTSRRLRTPCHLSGAPSHESGSSKQVILLSCYSLLYPRA